MIMNVKAHGESPDLPAGVMATRSAISARAYSGLTSAQPSVRCLIAHYQTGKYFPESNYVLR